ncbi:hypothetical protein HW555_009905 [Spodoptera exigua]|uniref:Uncharacterized protein n=1 Tax=Spodoptera exigua TaxID=7107 RepID=A0A835GA52_SPOEX|nr:hypothetical protein HW555_009905 [Spodoptera exigua]
MSSAFLPNAKPKSHFCLVMSLDVVLGNNSRCKGKFFLLVLMITFSQHIASSHILTSAYMDMSLPTCMRILSYTLMNDLCPTYGVYYGDYSSEEANMPPFPKEVTIKKWEQRRNSNKKMLYNTVFPNRLVVSVLKLSNG